MNFIPSQVREQQIATFHPIVRTQRNKKMFDRLYSTVLVTVYLSQFILSHTIATEHRPTSSATFNASADTENFLIVEYLSDSEVERRLHWHRMFAKETSVMRTALWQLTDGQHLVQMIYLNGELIDCECLRDDTEAVENFMDSMLSENEYLRRHHQLGSLVSHPKHMMYSRQMNLDPARNVSYVKLKKFRDIPSDLVGKLQMKTLWTQCNALHKQIKELMVQQQHDESFTR